MALWFDSLLQCPLLLSQAKENENSQAQSCQCLHTSQVHKEFSVFTGVSDFFFFPLTCAPSVSRCWEFVCFEECEKRWAWGYLTWLRLEHLFQLLFLGCKWPVFTFSFSIKSSCSSPCLSNTALASWKDICGREKEAPGLSGRCQRSGWELVGMAAVLWELCVPAGFPALLPVYGCSSEQQAGLSQECRVEGPWCSTPRVCLKYSPSLLIASSRDVSANIEDGWAAVITQRLPYNYTASSLYNYHIKLP